MHIRKNSCLLMLSVLLMTVSSCNNTEETVIGEDFPDNISYTELRLGKDYTDLHTKIRFLTNRVDLIDSVDNGKNFQSYVNGFHEMYPNIEIIYEGIANYDEDVRVRLPSPGWGDICCIPSNINGDEFTQYFEPLAELQELEDNYRFLENSVYHNIVYGIPSGGNVLPLQSVTILTALTAKLQKIKNWCNAVS